MSRQAGSGKVEQYPPPKVSPLCPQNVIVFQIRHLPRVSTETVYSWLQRSVHQLRLYHYL
jgi:hypothetical protein